MGGATLTMVAENKTRALAKIRTEMGKAFRMGLYPDSALVVMEYGAEKAFLYQVELSLKDNEIKVTPIKEGPCFHVGVAAKFGPELKPGQWLATVHVHT